MTDPLIRVNAVGAIVATFTTVKTPPPPRAAGFTLQGFLNDGTARPEDLQIASAAQQRLAYEMAQFGVDVTGHLHCDVAVPGQVRIAVTNDCFTQFVAARGWRVEEVDMDEEWRQLAAAAFSQAGVDGLLQTGGGAMLTRVAAQQEG